jgi:hypothetical protein
LIEAATAYCDRLNEVLWAPTEEDPWRRVQEPQGRFMDAAKAALRQT